MQRARVIVPTALGETIAVIWRITLRIARQRLTLGVWGRTDPVDVYRSNVWLQCFTDQPAASNTTRGRLAQPRFEVREGKPRYGPRHLRFSAWARRRCVDGRCIAIVDRWRDDIWDSVEMDVRRRDLQGGRYRRKSVLRVPKHATDRCCTNELLKLCCYVIVVGVDHESFISRR